ncbi:YdgA family protein [Desulfurispirillum indicum]|uniref:YdgA family protein n=1 Tax=Desulfurispirillum indicum TaxID=936456 RepID=UPI001CFA0A25|nr:YdgA family protein [Desulfurispirillum indicum]UCZ57657.1 YdgA family protein [Desulfurispirillum indicum]
MKKFFVILLLTAAIVAVALAVPYYSGGVFSQYYQQAVDSTLSSNEYQVSTVSYQRGWLSSTIHSRIEVIDPDLRDALSHFFSPYIEVHSKVSHGLSGVKSRSTFYPGGRENPQNFFPEGENALLLTNTSLHGQTALQLTIPQLSLSYTEHGMETFLLQSGKFLLSMDISSDMNSFRGTSELDELYIMAGDELLEMGKLVIIFDQSRMTPYLFEGQQSAEIAFIQLSAAEGEPANMSQILYTFDARSTANDSLDFSFMLAVEKGSLEGMEIGPAAVELELRNLKTVHLNDFFAAIDNGLNVGSHTLEQDFLHYLLLAMGDGAQLESPDFSLATEFGTLRGDFLLDIPPFEEDYFDLLQFSDEIKAHFNLSLPADLVTALDMETAILLHLLMAQGIIRMEESNYHIDAQLEQGILFINGTPMPLNLPFGLR